jgi:hypothetical protein
MCYFVLLLCRQAAQLGLALRREVDALQTAGSKIIQVCVMYVLFCVTFVSAGSAVGPGPAAQGGCAADRRLQDHPGVCCICVISCCLVLFLCWQAAQLGLALRREVDALQTAGCKIIQVCANLV